MAARNFSLCDFIRTTTDGVIKAFIEQCEADGIEYTYLDRFPPILLIKGKRPDKVLLVAHADTVWGNAPITTQEVNGVVFNSNLELYYRNGWKESKYRDAAVGIGADDRAGCFILSRLLRSGHSLLINTMEEIHIGHMINSREPEVQEFVKEHRFAIEFDRGNGTDLVYYNDETNVFKSYIASNYPGYKEAPGSGSDIAKLCKGLIPAVNISTGYYYAHSPYEYIILDELFRTLDLTENFLRKNQSAWYGLEGTCKP